MSEDSSQGSLDKILAFLVALGIIILLLDVATGGALLSSIF